MLEGLTLYQPGAGLWWSSSKTPGRAFEVSVSGDDNAPDPTCLARASALVDRIDEHVALARQYLDTFVDRSRFAAGGDNWYLEGVHCLRESDTPAKEIFSLEFSLEGDLYGLWCVAFCDQMPSDMRRPEYPLGLPQFLSRVQQ